jgi:hypothetical protein
LSPLFGKTSTPADRTTGVTRESASFVPKAIVGRIDSRNNADERNVSVLADYAHDGEPTSLPISITERGGLPVLSMEQPGDETIAAGLFGGPVVALHPREAAGNRLDRRAKQGYKFRWEIQ